MVIYFLNIPGFSYAPSSVGQQETPTPPKQPEFSQQEDADIKGIVWFRALKKREYHILAS